MKHFIFLNTLAAKTALIHLFKQPLGSLLTLLMLAIAMTLPLSLYLGLQNSASLLGKLNEAPQVTVFLELSADSVDIATIQNNLDKRDDLKKIEFIPKTQAIEHLQRQLGEDDLSTLLGDNPLPDAFILTPENTTPENLQTLQSTLSSLPMVEEVQVDTEWAQTLFNMVQAIEKITWFLGITLSLAFILVAHNTIRLQILSQKEAIEITRLLGAPASFIRRPFLYQAFWQGLFSCILALLLCTWVTSKAQPLLGNILKQYGLVLDYRFFSGGEMGIVLVLMIILAILGAFLAVHTFLKGFKTGC